jgi:hypothetical protein
LESVLKDAPAPAFEKPIPDPDYSTLKPIMRGQWMGNNVVEIDSITGLRATADTPIESRVEKIITDVQDILYWVNKKDPRGPAPTNPSSDPQFHLWNPPVQTWWLNNQSKYNITTLNDIPNNYDSLHSTVTKPTITISGLSPEINSTATTTISIKTENQYPLTSVDLFINNNFLTTLSAPFQFRFTPSEYGYQPGSYTLKATGTNSIYSKNSTEFSFKII